MLSRAADNLYWMARYLERAENLARLVDTNAQFLLDAGLSADPRSSAGWQPILRVCDLDEEFHRCHEETPTLRIPDFLVLDRRNSDSIRQCVALARENARMVRDQLSEEMWRELNRLHLFLQDSSAEDEWEFSPQDFCDRIVRFSLLFQGLVEATIAQQEGYCFIHLGKHLERVDKTTRILDIPTHHANALAVSPWPTVLRACSARSAYLSLRGASITEEDALALLLFDHGFPRSVRFCLNEVDTALHQITGTVRGSYGNEAERLAGATLANIDFNGSGDFKRLGIHDYADGLQQQINDIGQQIFETYVLLPAEVQQLPAASYAMTSIYQQMQQQQQ